MSTINERKRKHTANVRDKVYKATHSVVDKASTIVSEDLTAPIRSRKRRSRDSKRRLGAWVKGILAQALTRVSQRRGASLHLVNAAYTSQTDHRHGVLLGDRRGDRFYCFDGVVLDADENAARNILARHSDPEIGRWMPYRQVRLLLRRRTEHWLSTEGQRLGLLNQDSSCVPF
jgi:IS605 OrfB family transposase